MVKMIKENRNEGILMAIEDFVSNLYDYLTTMFGTSSMDVLLIPMKISKSDVIVQNL